MGDLGRRDGDAAQAQLAGVILGRTHGDEAGAGEIGERGGPADAVEVAGGRVHPRRALGDQPRGQVPLGRPDVAQRDVGLAPGQVLQVVRGDQPDADLGRGPGERGEDRRQGVGRHHVRGGDRDLARDLLGPAGGGQREPGGGLLHRADMDHQLAPRLRQDEPAPHPVEELHAEAVLQRRDLAPEGRLGLAELTCGGRERSGLGGGEEGAGLVPVEGGGGRIHASLYNADANAGNSYAFPFGVRWRQRGYGEME
jgi:hypothetical protein